MEHKDYRQDERQEAAFQRYESERDKEAFVQGAAWADEHPMQGLWNSEKVIEWLRNNQLGFILTDMDITDLRKAIEVENDAEL